MAETSAIAWTKSTFNPWIGCTKVGPGCDHCYAETLDKRHKWGGGVHWGAGVPRFRTSPSNWKKPLQWETAQATLVKSWNLGVERLGGEEALLAKGFVKPEPWRVFCASLADVFDNEVPQEWRDDLWNLIEATPHLSWLLVTKRIGNVPGMVPDSWMGRHGFPPQWPSNIRLLITIVDQAETNRDVPKLLHLPCKNGISYEPALGPVDWRPWLGLQCDYGSVPAHGGGRTCPRCNGNASPGCGGIEWIIAGGESGPKARPAHPDWFRSLRDQCKAADVPFFFKQWGEWLFGEPRDDGKFIYQDGHVDDPGVSDGLDIIYAHATSSKQFESIWHGYWCDGAGNPLRRVRKKTAGCKLDGREHMEYPT